MKNKVFLIAVIVVSALFMGSVCSAEEKKKTVTLSELMAGIVKYEKKEVALSSTIVGACNSGCKIWVADGVYKKGNPVALVWAKDKAFTFKTNATGRQVILKGYAVGKYIDLCAVEKEAKAAENKEGDCNPIIETETGKKQLNAITFFATSVEYL